MSRRSPLRANRYLPKDLLMSEMQDSICAYYRPAEVCKITGMGRTFIAKAIREGRLGSRKLGGARLISEHDLRAFLGTTPTETTP